MEKEEQDLRERTKAFALRIIRLFSALPKTTVAQTLGKQILRSGTSVGANYREAYRGRSKAEFIAKCGDSLRELEETVYWLELLVDGGNYSSGQVVGFAPGMRRTDCRLRDHPQTLKGIMIRFPNSAFLPLPFRQAHQLFGEQLSKLLAELNEVLAA